MNRRVSVALVLGLIAVAAGVAALIGWGENPDVGVDDFIALVGRDREKAVAAVTRIETQRHPGSMIMLVECYPHVRFPDIDSRVREHVKESTGRSFKYDLRPVLQWIWQQKYHPYPNYDDFKARLYQQVDPRFSEYFADTKTATIRLDEILWGGVQRDGIPPLKNPAMIAAAQVDYLADSNVVFGIDLNGDARAYPKRILAWHEMFKDTIGGESVCGVYCTLCGSMIVYRTDLEGEHYELGTSGFLYRSNKLMYDHATQSLWSTLAGEPVVGPLVGKGIKLEKRYVVTTTWGEWKRRHPDTKVLSLDTGHQRDYREGAAYADYFATDELMFAVPDQDTRLKNKDEVLALRSDESPGESLAISATFLIEHPVYHDRVGERDIVVITTPDGANRVYASGGQSFRSWDGESTVMDEDAQEWTLSESALSGPTGQTLERLPAHRAFWFGWHAQYPNTRLVK